MPASLASIDARTRHLLRTTEGELCRHLAVQRLGIELVGELYVRIRDVLLRSPSVEDPNGGSPILDDLALSIYLAVAADEAAGCQAPELLTALRNVLAQALSAPVPGAESDSSVDRRGRRT